MSGDVIIVPSFPPSQVCGAGGADITSPAACSLESVHFYHFPRFYLNAAEALMATVVLKKYAYNTHITTARNPESGHGGGVVTHIMDVTCYDFFAL